MKGHPIIGAICGFLFGDFLSLLLLTTGVLATDSILLVALPIVFLIVGIAIAAVAPFKRDRLQPAGTTSAGAPPAAPPAGS